VRDRRLVLGATLAAAGIACFWFVEAYPAFIYDSWGYHYLAEIIRTRGLLAWPTDIRTYGYPLFLAAVSGFRAVPQEELRLVVFAVQWAAWLAACAYVGRKLAAVSDSPPLGAAAYALGALNPILLLHTAEPLSDLLSAVLILASVALAWKAPAHERPRTPTIQIFLSFFFAAASVALRPANIVVVAALVLVWAIRAIRWRDVGLSGVCAAIAGLVPPFIPQVLINHRLFGTFNPLIEKDLYRQQANWGMGALKYATLVQPDQSPFLVYVNPLYRGDATPALFLRHHPLDYLTTLALHGFAMIDPDLPFTYVTDLAPWYRWPLSVFSYLLVYGALVGTFVGAARILRRRELAAGSFVVLSTVLVAGACLVLYLPVEVEGRFGLPLLALATPLAVAGVALLRGGPPLRRSAKTLLALGAFAAVLGGAALSRWISTTRTNPRINSPANAFVMDPKRARTTPRPAP
jgi:uncharacterized membrane protein YhaH (DUF805 family)